MHQEDDSGPDLTSKNRVWLAGVLVLAGIVALLVTCGSCAAGPRAVWLPRLYAPATAQLVMEGAGSCTAWKISSDMIATAGHCCDDGYEYSLSGDNAPVGDLERPAMLVDDDVHDVCVLRAKMRGQSIPLADEEPEVGEPVWTAGYPQGRFLISDGYWSGHDGRGQNVCSVVVHGGSSGSPILDASGRAVGVLVARVELDNLTIVAPLEWLARAKRVAEMSGGEAVRLALPTKPNDMSDLDSLLRDILKTLPTE